MGSRVSALPPIVKLDAKSDKSIAEQLFEALKAHSAKLIDLFREWDDDGNGAVDKREMRMGIAALGYKLQRRKSMLSLKVSTMTNGMIEFEELKEALKEKNVKRATKALREKRRKSEAASSLLQMSPRTMLLAKARRTLRQHAPECHGGDAADADNDGKLDFAEFCQFVRDREVVSTEAGWSASISWMKMGVARWTWPSTCNGR